MRLSKATKCLLNTAVLVLFGALVALFPCTPPSHAQAIPSRLSVLRLNVWPEYDQPAVLVIFEGVVAGELVTPVPLEVVIPAGATVHAVAYRDASGNLMTLPWEASQGADGQVIAFAVDQPEFVVEYYADIIAPPPQRSFDISFKTPLETDQVQMTVRQPSGASQMQIAPELPQAGVDNLGNPQFSADLGPLAAGQAIDLSVSYAKADVTPSVSAEGEQPSPSPQPDQTAAPAWLYWLAGILLGTLAAVAAVLFAKRYRQRNSIVSRQARRRQERAAAKRGNQSVAPTGGKNDQFCRQCGSAFGAADRFCRQCGAERR
jgi:hypothetical protein